MLWLQHMLCDINKQVSNLRNKARNRNMRAAELPRREPLKLLIISRNTCTVFSKCFSRNAANKITKKGRLTRKQQKAEATIKKLLWNAFQKHLKKQQKRNYTYLGHHFKTHYYKFSKNCIYRNSNFQIMQLTCINCISLYPLCLKHAKQPTVSLHFDP